MSKCNYEFLIMESEDAFSGGCPDAARQLRDVAEELKQLKIELWKQWEVSSTVFDEELFNRMSNEKEIE